MPNNELTHPSGPINGRTLVNLKAVLESFLGGGEVRDLDLALLMNVPLNRLSQLKRAKSSIYTVGRTSDKGVGLDAEEGGEESAELPGIRPSQAILVRLLLKRPGLVPIPLRPSNAEVFDLLQPFMGVVDHVKYIKSGGKSGFAPLFGRSYISSYKMLGEGAAGMQNAGLPVARLQMLVVGKYAQFFRECLRKYAVQSRSVPAFVKETLQCKTGWGLLREKDSLTDWMDDALHDRFESDVYALFSQWFSNCYLDILKNEAKSRDLDPVAAIIKGRWVNSSEVSDDKLRQYDRFSRPILGSSDSLFSLFRESFGLTSAEAYWVLGLQVKAFYRFRQQPDCRVDAPTSILLRYLFQYPEDIGLFMPKPMSGAEIFDKIKDEDGNFKLGQLAPLFGASRVMSYEFSNPDSPCPFFARRLAMVFQAAFSGGEPIYKLLRECVEEEVQARGLSSDLFWRDGRWHK